jgi:hypothetical protein
LDTWDHKKGGCLEVETAPFIPIPDEECFRLTHSKDHNFTYDTSSFLWIHYFVFILEMRETNALAVIGAGLKVIVV